MARPGIRTTSGWLAVALLVVTAFWGGRSSVETVSAAARASTDGEAEAILWEVRRESIGRTLTFAGEISATTAPGPLANVDGIVTGVLAAQGVVVAANEELLEVDLRPVVAGLGTVPAFRDLQEGAEGEDVGQLRRFLCATGHLTDCGAEARFTAAVTGAVNAWHQSRGLPTDGTVRVSDIMWFPELPVEVRPAPGVATGSRVAAGDRPLLAVSGAPRLDVLVTRDQAALVPPGSLVRLGEQTSGVVTGVGPATTGEQGDASQEALSIEVAAPDGQGNICAPSEECRLLLQGRASVTVEVAVEVVPEQDGTGVPVRAVLTGADDSTYVLREDGERVPVSVVGSSGGIVLVEGLAVGDRVVVSSDEG